jgi:hypothetical protein
MKVIPFDDTTGWVVDHPTGDLSFKHLVGGEPGTLDNFMYILARQDRDFLMPRHRHNFEQIRLPIRGSMNIGRGIELAEGDVGYFVEGLPYGPQEDLLGAAKPGERKQLVLQFGGASNYGFMSIQERRKARDELAKVGTWIGPNFQMPGKKIEWGLNTIWRHVYGVKLKYPKPRYKNVIVACPKRFNWIAIPGARGVEHKYLGAFSERGVWTEFVKLNAGAKWSTTDARARRLLVVLSGAGTAEGQPAGYLTTIQADMGETLQLTATEEMQLFMIGLPPISPPVVESDQYDETEMLPEDEPA